MKAQRSQLKSLLTAAIVDFCQKQDLFLTELHIQGTVCITTDSTSTLVTQISEKVCGNGGGQCDNNSSEDISEIGQALESSGILARLREAKHDQTPEERLEGEARSHRQSEHSHGPPRRPAPPVSRQRHHSDRSESLQRYQPAGGYVEQYRESSAHSEQYGGFRTQDDHREYRGRMPSGGSLESRAYGSLKLEPEESTVQGEGSDGDNGRPGMTYDHRRHSGQLADVRPSDDVKPEMSSASVTAAAMAIYSYIRSPTYQTAGEGHPGQSYLGVRGHTGSHQRELDVRHSAMTTSPSVSPQSSQGMCTLSASSPTVSTSKMSFSDPYLRPGPSPSSVPGVQSAYYHLPMTSSHEMSLRLPVDLSSRLVATSSPSSLKGEPMRQLHVVTQPPGPSVPSLVSPSAQAAASAMAALSGLQAAIMPTSPEHTATSPTTTVATATTSQSGFGNEEEERETPPENTSPESTLSSLQMMDTPINSHFRKMMLKSLQGKYKVLKTPEGRYKCPVCGASYLYQPNLRKHLEKAHLGKSYKCEFCGQKFTSVQGYSFHRKVKHRDLMPYRCELCRDAFYSYTAFLQHKKRTHSNQPGCVAIAQAKPPPCTQEDDSV